MEIYIHAIKIIEKFECAANVINAEFQQALQDFIANLIKADPSIRILGINVIDLSANKIDIQDPDQAYKLTRNQALMKLGAITEDAPAYEIVSTYANIARFAQYARCNYPGKPNEVLLLEEQLKFENLQIPWVRLNPAVN